MRPTKWCLSQPKLFILEKVNFGQPTKCWSNLVNFGQTRFKLVLFGTGHYKVIEVLNDARGPTDEDINLEESTTCGNFDNLFNEANKNCIRDAESFLL